MLLRRVTSALRDATWWLLEFRVLIKNGNIPPPLPPSPGWLKMVDYSLALLFAWGWPQEYILIKNQTLLGKPWLTRSRKWFHGYRPRNSTSRKPRTLKGLFLPSQRFRLIHTAVRTSNASSEGSFDRQSGNITREPCMRFSPLFKNLITHPPPHGVGNKILTQRRKSPLTFPVKHHFLEQEMSFRDNMIPGFYQMPP